MDKVFHDAGALVGPLLGGLLLAVDFRVVALAAGVVFAVLTVAQLLVLPPRAVQRHDRGVLGSWGEVVTNRRFVAFALFCSVELALFNQLYLALPVEAERVTGSGASVSAVFLLYTVAAIAVQVRITAWCRARWSAGTSVAVGLAVQGAGFLPLMISSPWLDTDVGAGSV
ncbi:MAG: MFS transporter [Pseudonocardiaceae bacterium]